MSDIKAYESSSEENIKDLAWARMVLLYQDEFTNSDIERHEEIPERFARPYEKKSWPEYKKLFI